jgi:hypothetical protein
VVVAPDINLTVPSCADRIPFLAEFTAVDCEGAPDFGEFTVTGFGQFAGRVLLLPMLETLLRDPTSRSTTSLKDPAYRELS